MKIRITLIEGDREDSATFPVNQSDLLRPKTDVLKWKEMFCARYVMPAVSVLLDEKDNG